MICRIVCSSCECGIPGRIIVWSLFWIRVVGLIVGLLGLGTFFLDVWLCMFVLKTIENKNMCYKFFAFLCEHH